MSDILGLAFVVLLVALVAALLSGNPSAWAREEWRRMWSETWAEAPKPDVNTANDPRVQATLARLADAKAAMKFRGTRLLIENRPAWQKVVLTPTEKPDARVFAMKARRK